MEDDRPQTPIAVPVDRGEVPAPNDFYTMTVRPTEFIDPRHPRGYNIGDGRVIRRVVPGVNESHLELYTPDTTDARTGLGYDTHGIIVVEPHVMAWS